MLNISNASNWAKNYRFCNVVLLYLLPYYWISSKQVYSFSFLGRPFFLNFYLDAYLLFTVCNGFMGSSVSFEIEYCGIPSNINKMNVFHMSFFNPKYYFHLPKPKILLNNNFLQLGPSGSFFSYSFQS